MAESETELKFQVPPARRTALRKALATSTAVEVPLRAAYYDTGDERLARAALALRVRQEGADWVQALKGRGDGLLTRLEHEVRLPATRRRPRPDPRLHAGSAAGARLDALLADGAPLVERYRTDIRRLQRVVRHAGARIEIAFDEGRIVAGAVALPVCEVEFELRAGPRDALLALAGRWVDRFGLVLDVRTKSERGVALARGALPRPSKSAPPATARFEARLADALRHLLPAAAAVAAGAGPDWEQALDGGLDRLLRLADRAGGASWAAFAGALRDWQARPDRRAALADPAFTQLMLQALRAL